MDVLVKRILMLELSNENEEKALLLLQENFSEYRMINKEILKGSIQRAQQKTRKNQQFAENTLTNNQQIQPNELQNQTPNLQQTQKLQIQKNSKNNNSLIAQSQVIKSSKHLTPDVELYQKYEQMNTQATRSKSAKVSRIPIFDDDAPAVDITFKAKKRLDKNQQQEIKSPILQNIDKQLFSPNTSLQRPSSQPRFQSLNSNQKSNAKECNSPTVLSPRNLKQQVNYKQLQNNQQIEDKILQRQQQKIVLNKNNLLNNGHVTSNTIGANTQLKTQLLEHPNTNLSQTLKSRPGGFQISMTNLNFNEVKLNESISKTIYVAMQKGDNYCAKFSIKCSGSNQLKLQLKKNNDFYVLTVTICIQSTGNFRGSVSFISNKEKKTIFVSATIVSKDQDTASNFKFNNVTYQQLNKSKIQLTEDQKKRLMGVQTPEFKIQQNNFRNQNEVGQIKTNTNTDDDSTDINLPNQKINLKIKTDSKKLQEQKFNARQQTLLMAQKFNIDPRDVLGQFDEAEQTSTHSVIHQQFDQDDLVPEQQPPVQPEAQVNKDDYNNDFKLNKSTISRMEHNVVAWNCFVKKNNKQIQQIDNHNWFIQGINILNQCD